MGVRPSVPSAISCTNLGRERPKKRLNRRKQRKQRNRSLALCSLRYLVFKTSARERRKKRLNRRKQRKQRNRSLAPLFPPLSPVRNLCRRTAEEEIQLIQLMCAGAPSP